jgi:hypothetical protein
MKKENNSNQQPTLNQKQLGALLKAKENIRKTGDAKLADAM